MQTYVAKGYVPGGATRQSIGAFQPQRIPDYLALFKT
jgi:hypothetical protein